jgi:hypothetical protein
MFQSSTLKNRSDDPVKCDIEIYFYTESSKLCTSCFLYQPYVMQATSILLEIHNRAFLLKTENQTIVISHAHMYPFEFLYNLLLY